MIERETKQEGDDTHIGSMHLLNALKAKPAKKQPQSKGLMHVEAKVNGMSTKAMIDTGATHNFVSEEEARDSSSRHPWRQDGSRQLTPLPSLHKE